MLNVQATKCPSHRIITIPDESFEMLDEHTYKLRLRPCEYKSNILISPHRHENRISTDILKFRLYCLRHSIKITSYGSMNQLPFLGIFSDEVILETNSKLSEDMYNDSILTGNGVVGDPGPYAKQGTKLIDVERGHMRREACHEITDDETVDYFGSMDLFIRESSYRLFRKLTHARVLPRNCFWAEILITKKLRREMTKYPYHRPVVGLDRSFQQSLLDAHHDHFMSLQVLTSLLNNVLFLCGGGSANLFVVVPVLAVAMVEQLLHPPVQNVYRKLAERRHGSIGKEVPFMTDIRFPELPMKVWEMVDEGSKHIKANVTIEKYTPPEEKRAKLLL